MADHDWSVISNEHTIEDAERANQLHELVAKTRELFEVDLKLDQPKAHLFPASHRYSTYLIAVVAGPYGFYERNEEGLPPMRIYARKSLLESVNHELMFNVTIGGMWFYKEMFGKAYPFRKYD